MNLPTPDATALAHSQALTEKIIEALEQADGWLAFDDYMRLALYAPGLGYYSGGARRFGQLSSDGSDFVTAPELTPLFGQTLARQVAQVLKLSAPQVLEFGAGSGALAADLLLTLNDDCERYFMLEVSASLREQQRATLQQRCPQHLGKVVWLNQLPATFSGCIVGNEVLDAMPVKRVVLTEHGWHEQGVVWRNGQFDWQVRPLTELAAQALNSDASLTAAAPTLAPGYTTEVGLEAQGFIRTVAGFLKQGAALFIDYGFPAREFYHSQRTQGTLMCHYRHHAHDNPFLYPGLQDITAHVNFTVLAETALAAGADHAGYASQARFLLNAGITELLAEQPDEARWRANSAVQKLISEAEMGELFKVWAFSCGLNETLLGFQLGDRSHCLG